jgi:Zn-dependent M28 family amino/carboxypeptidase
MDCAPDHALPRATARLALLLTLLIGACGAPRQAPAAWEPTPSTVAAADRITADYLRDWVARLSADELGGRGPGTAGDEQARRLLAGELERLGFAPGAPGGAWEQPFEIVGVTADVPPRWRFHDGSESIDLAWWEDFIVAAGAQRERIALQGTELVFVGYGIQAPEEGWDDFGDTDLSGKVLVMLNNDPDWDPDLFGGERRLYYGRWTYKYESAARQGAAGAIIIHTTPSAGYGWNVVQTSWSGEQLSLPQGDEPVLPVHAWITEESARQLCALAGEDLDALVERARRRDFEPVPLGVHTDLTITAQVRRTRTANVLGLLRGSDPELSEEAVVLSAHHDHLGTREPDATGDRIYNGALDNAAAMAQALGIARAFAALPQPPRRSLLVAFVGAEESGLLGSKHFVRQPTFPPGRIAGAINLELANRWGPTRDVTIFGRGKSTLEDVLARHAVRQGRVVEGEEAPDQGWYYRSDQLSFARAGVPALWARAGTDHVGRPEGWGTQQLDAWLAERYHQPGDELDATWDFHGIVQDARLLFGVALEVAQADAMASWYPGDEFERAREAALEALGAPASGVR